MLSLRHLPRGLRGALRALVLLAGPATLASCGAEPEPGTNLLLVTADTLRADHLGCAGHPADITPILDGLAARGLRFERAYAPMPQTLPSHTSLMTGLEPRAHGVLSNTQRLRGEVETLAEGLAARGFRTAAFVGAEVVGRRTGLARGFEVFDDPRAQGRDVVRKGKGVTTGAVAWVTGLEPGERFFLWAHYFDPHRPHEAPPRLLQQVPEEAIRGLVEERWDELRDFGESLSETVEDWRGYAADVLWTDRELGRLLEGLEAAQRLDRTAIVVAGDHGEGLGEHRHKAHSLNLYDELLHVPLVVVPPPLRGRPGAAPGLEPGTRSATPVALAEVYSVLLELALLEPGGERPALRQLLERPARPVFAERPHFTRGDFEHKTARLPASYEFGEELAVILGHEKLLLRPGDVVELYDLAADPAEAANLATERPERAAELRALLSEWTARLPEPGTEGGETVDEEQREALQALGYVR